MKKRIALTLFALIMLVSIFALSACDGKDDAPTAVVHTHNYSEWIPEVPYTCDSEGTLGHYFCAGCGKYFDSDLFEISDITITPEHSWEESYACDASNHWLVCKICGETSIKAAHEIGNANVCSVCNGTVGATAGIIYELSSDKTFAVVKGYNGTAEKIVIDKEFNSVPVTAIGNEAFQNSKITSVFIPNTVTSIGKFAFYSCANLSDINFPTALTTIDDFAFSMCSSLTKLTIGNSVTYIGSHAFDSCSSISTITIGNGVKTIEFSAFKACEALTSIVIPDGVKLICDEAFLNCNKLTDIYYRGSEAEWQAISKGQDWDSATGNYKVTYNYTGE